MYADVTLKYCRDVGYVSDELALERMFLKLQYLKPTQEIGFWHIMEGIGKTSETKGPNSRSQSQLASSWDCMSIYSNDFKCVYIAPIVARHISSSTYAYQLLSAVSRAFHAYTVPVSTSTWNVLKLHTSCFYFVMDRIPTLVLNIGCAPGGTVS